MLAVGRERRALQAGLFAGLDPELPRLGNRDARAVGSVDAGSDLDIGGGREIVGRLLLREGLEPALAGLVDIVDDPSFFLDRPSRFSRRACGLTLQIAPIQFQWTRYVAKISAGQDALSVNLTRNLFQAKIGSIGVRQLPTVEGIVIVIPHEVRNQFNEIISHEMLRECTVSGRCNGGYLVAGELRPGVWGFRNGDAVVGQRKPSTP